MRVLFLIVFFSAILLKTSLSQEFNTKQVKDTLVTEEIIYEVDTVYLQPDTVSLFDTIVHYTIKPVRKLPFFVEVAGSSFLSGIYDFTTIDTLTVRKTANYSGALTFAYTNKTVFCGINIGFSQLEENFSYQNSINSSSAQYPNASYYDSLIYTGSCTIRNYYNYLNAALVVGKKWTGRGKLSYRAILHTGCDILLNHSSFSALSDADNKIPSPTSELRKIAWYFDVSASIGYRIGKKTDVFVAPYSKLTLKSGKSYPLSNKAIIGLRLGFIKYF